MLVVITIHGIGFQQAPSSLAASDGYADALHEGLRRHLGELLGDDPTRIAAGGRGPVYAQSNYPPLTHATEPGLRRLGSWTASGTVAVAGVPLAEPGKQVAHVALVYSGLESQQSDLAALHDLAVLAKPDLGSYATLGGLGHMLVADLEALRQHPTIPGAPGPSLRPRTGTVPHRGIVDRLLRRPGDPPAAAPGGGAPGDGSTGVLRTVEDDVAAYVTSNQHRERVRMFLRDAISRILARPDVEGAVINGHSNGTVMGFDMIAAISPPSAPAVRALITAGSPLRKYADLLQWGDDAGNLRLISGGWTNLWDPLDPVADPLAPPSGWKRGEPIPAGGGPGMFVVHDPDTGAEAAMPVVDVQVDNVHDSTGGGLRAHNYWDNDAFCAAAAAVISGALG
ncbi:MAG: hypothetical protein ABSE52_02210 [Candidatus Dormibacteria bacterium]|jgi:hypothetical protein